eukprot:TRINITY_DN4027_c2_g1_i1.p1 TRINITY_DN4027_c2_g1~~TRINITY_DN4027_c2_g1_i1.p1  ORF type:complete len:392 (+),score=211.10 TRINITY_DN4027_c2_g1_i1:52-1227(+)
MSSSSSLASFFSSSFSSSSSSSSSPSSSSLCISSSSCSSLASSSSSSSSSSPLCISSSSSFSSLCISSSSFSSSSSSSFSSSSFSFSSSSSLCISSSSLSSSSSSSFSSSSTASSPSSLASFSSSSSSLSSCSSAFSFHLLETKFCEDNSKEVLSLFQKWNLAHGVVKKLFRYDQHFDLAEKNQLSVFLHDLFNSEAFQKNVQILSKGKQLVRVPNKIESVRFVPIASSLITMDIFDRLYKLGIVSESSRQIKKCLEEDYESVQIADELRKALLIADSDHYHELFSAEERSELLIRLFSHLVVGGPICQYEDSIVPYLDTTKLLYKDFLRVFKNQNTDKLEIANSIFEIKDWKSEGAALFASRSPFNLCFVSIDTEKRHVTFFHYCFLPYW